MMEMMLCQKILKECGGTASPTAGYIQHLHGDPFGVHVYTDCGLQKVAEHLEKLTPSHTSHTPNQTKRILYHAFVLPGKGKDTPPLPVSELISDEHSTPTLTFWPTETLRQLYQITTRKVHQIETGFNWALIASVLQWRKRLIRYKQSTSNCLPQSEKCRCGSFHSAPSRFIPHKGCKLKDFQRQLASML